MDEEDKKKPISTPEDIMVKSKGSTEKKKKKKKKKKSDDHVEPKPEGSSSRKRPDDLSMTEDKHVEQKPEGSSSRKRPNDLSITEDDGEEDKKKQKTPKDGEESVEKPEKEKWSKKKKEMWEFFDELKAKLTDLQRPLLTKADMDLSNMDDGELVLSWRKKMLEILGKPATQANDDCWAHALARALSILLRLEGSKGPFPTPGQLIQAVDEEHLTKDKGISNIRFIAPYLLRMFKRKLVRHRRPAMGETQRNEDYEALIERLLAKHPVAVEMEYVPSYPKFSHKDKAVFSPDDDCDLDAMRFERLLGHYLVITGHGIVIRDGKEIKFWECLDSQGPDYGDEGYIRLERHKCLISGVFEFRVV